MVPMTDLNLNETVRSYWVKRVWNHMADTYCGISMMKFPEDLRSYEHLIWETQPEVIVEIGCRSGGSTLWFKDRLEILRRHGGQSKPFRVVGIDLEVSKAEENVRKVYPEYAKDIVFLKGDVLDAKLPDRVKEVTHGHSRFMVIEDSAHKYESTMAALNNFSPMIEVGGFFVVEDTCVDDEQMRPAADWPRGAGKALGDWLSKNPHFKRRRDFEAYGLTCHPGGFLERTS